MQAILGVLFHSLGGVAAGSFYMPYNKVKGWSWETYWMVGGVMSWLIVPPIAAWLTVPGFLDIIATSSSSILLFTFIMGLLWGVGGLSYGLGVRYLGMSLGNSVVLGFCAAFGAVVPSIYYNINPQAGKVSITDMLASSGGQIVLLGVLVCIIGIAVCGKAGIMKEKELSEEEKKKSVSEFNLVKGLIVAVLSGILSSFFSFGIESGKPMADAAVAAGYDHLFANNVTFVVILWGGLVSNLVWTTMLSLKNKSYKDFINKSTPVSQNLMFSALAGIIWFLQFFFYGMGESKLGNGASSWILHMSTIILTANLWGVYRKEWYGVAKKTKYTITTGILVILLSVVLVGIGNSI
ncbi:L-rhamnose/proton symporter RhaT [Algibacter amylolyticus]|uniref:L-rhamnose/proton symporter RhaT n=1 Tax=Algibacter amylolyticus TaxID=1608400 RepID=A0A5M7B9F8_9FLAO|nr:L-rhamnose/proton symporter RhaT [Algibacter amylolyticus]KAA5824837.1 L-rhamnose/proton symporter RhaT [Algibacter amylolyticus]MBB5268963.1 L-rhamnose-H+ transport protein [Algibacter amylolyticus]TSJ76002.1 L-rhamnose/proton symporter RhaT [Algibacter amylolyticus]